MKEENRLFMETDMLCFVRARPFRIFSKNPIICSFRISIFQEMLRSASSRSMFRTVETPFSCIVTP